MARRMKIGWGRRLKKQGTDGVAHRCVVLSSSGADNYIRSFLISRRKTEIEPPTEMIKFLVLLQTRREIFSFNVNCVFPDEVNY